MVQHMAYPGKRVLDLIIALPAAIVMSPFMLAVAAVVAQRLGRPVLFRQIRPGLHGRPFILYKFRTMRNDYDASGQSLPDEVRLTPLGRFLRATSVDELPELFNVIRGEMSLVGPRPLLMRYLDRYTPEQARRNEVKPGLTGLAQINGRNAVSWEERFSQDVWYVDHQSFQLDIRIIMITIWKALLRKDINALGHATKEEFQG